MIQYISTKGGSPPVDFDEAVLQGFAKDGGLFVPQTIPRIPNDRLEKFSHLSYTDLAFEMLSLFIDPGIIPSPDLKQLIHTSFSNFGHPDLMPLVPLNRDKTFLVMELFHGPTLSFKDIAMGFLINTMDYLLTKKDRHLSVVLATTGDTGPAAAHAAAGKKTLDCWPLYPAGMISEEQERQMTTLTAENIHPVGVENCNDGGDDLDIVVAKLFMDPQLKTQLNLSSVNSINWCRVMVQAVHHAYGYFKACNTVGDPVVLSVPSGAYGNLFAGYLARQMGIPIHTFVCANNRNKTLHTAFSTGIFKKQNLVQTVSSAIDIVVPYNFWRFLYFSSGSDADKLNAWMNTFEQDGEIHLDKKTSAAIRKGYASCSVSDEATLDTIKETWERNGYLLDPHGAVAVAAARKLEPKRENPIKTICFATAHPAKFPAVIQKALGKDVKLPAAASHSSLMCAATLAQKRIICDKDALESVLVKAMKKREKERISSSSGSNE